MRLYVVILFLNLMMSVCWGMSAAPTEIIHVEVVKVNEYVEFDTFFVAPVSLSLAWSVMTDFDHMTEFMPYLNESKVLSRDGAHWRVEQKGVVPVAFFSVNYQSIRDISVLPNDEIRSDTVGGDAGITRSVAKLKGDKKNTEVHYHAQWWPNSIMVAGFGLDAMRELIVRQFTAMRAEMLRRQAL